MYVSQERGGANFYNHDNLTLKFKMDNELEIIYVVSVRGGPDKTRRGGGGGGRL